LASVIRLRGNYTFLDVTLPRLIVSDSALRLLAREFHLLRHKINPRSPVFLFVVTISRRLHIQLVGEGPFGFYFRSSLLTALFGHGGRPFLRNSICGFYTELARLHS
jgi:hypothetical protein